MEEVLDDQKHCSSNETNKCVRAEIEDVQIKKENPLTPVITQLRCDKKVQMQHPLTVVKTKGRHLKPAAHSEKEDHVKVEKRPHCHQTFSQPSSLGKHVKAVHKSNKCSVCDKTFLSSSNL
jgi:hypothetical protein